MRREEKETDLLECQLHKDSWSSYVHCEENYESEALEEEFYSFSGMENRDSERTSRE